MQFFLSEGHHYEGNLLWSISKGTKDQRQLQETLRLLPPAASVKYQASDQGLMVHVPCAEYLLEDKTTPLFFVCTINTLIL